jgi:hypothetical protein
MKLLQGLVSVSMMTTALAGSAVAQMGPETPAPSPHAKVEQRVGLTDISIEYSSPSVKGRKIWGELVPMDKLWRTGANMATKLTVSRDFTFGGKPVKAGSYALYTIPGKSSWTVILNPNWNTGGTNGYDEKTDAVRVTVKPTPMPNRERLTFLFSDTTDDFTALDLEWEKLRVRTPIKVDTKAHVMASIDQTLGQAWRPHMTAAQYLLNSGGDLDKALAYCDQSIAIQPTWWNHWVKAQIYGKKGKKAEALATVQKAQDLGKGDQVYENFFKEEVTKAAAGWK